MRPSLLFKIIMMVVALVGVMFAIRGLSANNMEHAMSAIGIEAGGAGAPGFQAAGRSLQPGDERFGICATRITAFNFGGGRRIVEQKTGLRLTWMAADPKPREIATLDVEKWLSQHCQVVVHELTPDQSVAARTLGAAESTLTLEYADGRQAQVRRFGDDVFELEGKLYKSEDLASALRELQTIAQFPEASGR